jgi:hypothetical protein
MDSTNVLEAEDIDIYSSVKKRTSFDPYSGFAPWVSVNSAIAKSVKDFDTKQTFYDMLSEELERFCVYEIESRNTRQTRLRLRKEFVV